MKLKTFCALLLGGLLVLPASAQDKPSILVIMGDDVGIPNISHYSFGMMGSMPLGALIIGFIIEAFGTMNAMVPAMVVSLVLCVYGFMFTGVGRYESPAYVAKS